MSAKILIRPLLLVSLLSVACVDTKDREKTGDEVNGNTVNGDEIKGDTANGDSINGGALGTGTGLRNQNVSVYDCDNDFSIVVSVENENAWVFFPGETVALPQVPSASGARYQKGEMSFWNKGHEAILKNGSEIFSNCIVNPQKSVWESAKLGGFDFRATGNKPTWFLEIARSGKIVFVTDFGATRYEFDTPQPVSDETERVTQYSVEKDGFSLYVLLVGRQCVDTMSDEVFETSALVTLNDQIFRGCGRALH